MYCKYCGKEIADNAMFCQYCGRKLTSTQEENDRAKTEEKSRTFETDSRYKYSYNMGEKDVVSGVKGRVVKAVLVILALLIIIGGYAWYTNYSKYHPSNENKYYSSAELGDHVYVDVNAIFPGIGIYLDGTSTYTDFVCECTTVSGDTVWVAFTVPEYKQYVDSQVSTAVDTKEQEEIFFSPSVRLHGVIVKADDYADTVEEDSGELIVKFNFMDRGQ